MMKTLSALTIAAALATVNTACSNEDLAIEQQPEAATTTAQAPVYHFNIPANMGNETRGVEFGGTIAAPTITTLFKTTEKVLVHNVTKDAWARIDDSYRGEAFGGYGYLQPSNISDDGKRCTLFGELKFYTYTPWQWDSQNNTWIEEFYTPVAIDASDTYNLYYQAQEDYWNRVFFSYGLQNGTIDTFVENINNDGEYCASSCNYAKAEGVKMALNGNTLTLDNGLSFNSLGSMFRQHLSFKDKLGNGIATTPNIQKLTLSTDHKTFVGCDSIKTEWHPGPNLVDNIDFHKSASKESILDANGDMYFALAFDNTAIETGDKLFFRAIDNDYNIYIGQKVLPTGGLKNGKFYYGEVELEHIGNCFPTITRGDGGTIPVPADQGAAPFDFININAYWDGDSNHDPVPIDMTISGYSEGFSFRFNNGGTVTLTGNGTAYSGSTYYPFILNDSYKEALTIILDSDYAISSPNYYYAIGPSSSANNITIKTTGGTHTLTLTTYGDDNGAYYKGIWNFKYDYYNISAGDVIPELAADANTTVTLTSASKNAEGNWVFIYTVTTTNP